MKNALIAIVLAFIFTPSNAQISVTKYLGKNADMYKMGYGIFSFYELPLNSEGNYKAIRLELLDAAIYPGKDGSFFSATYGIAYWSSKIGYKVIFSDTKTGFYLEPSAGYGRVIISYTGETSAATKGGLAAALEGGYSLEVGQNGHSFNFGLKYENDMAGGDYSLSSLGFRVSFMFNMFKKKE